MKIKPGILLISSPTLKDANFEKVVIFIVEYNEKGAMGFVINKTFPRVFNELVEFKHSLPFPLWDGGPVEKESLYFLHRRSDLIGGGTHIVDSVYLGGDFKNAVTLINSKAIQESDIKLLIGYCGWDNNELEKELEEGSWLLNNIDVDIVFSQNVEKLWEEIYNGKE